MNKIITSAFVISLAIMLPSCNNAQPNDQTNQTSNYVIPEPAGIVEGNGKVVPMSGIRYLSSELSGTVSAIHVKSNQQVTADQVLITLDQRKAEIALAKAKNKVQAQRARIKEAEVAVQTAKIDCQIAYDEFATAQRLYEKDAESKARVTELKNVSALKEAKYQERLQNLTTAKITLSEYQDEVRLASEDLANCTIKAPSDGKILDINVEIGNTVQPYSEILAFAADEPVIVDAEIDEVFANRLKIGMSVAVRLVGYGDDIAYGCIYEMADYLTEKSIFSGRSDEKQDRQMRRIKVLLDQEGELPLLGTKVCCRIDLASAPDKSDDVQNSNLDKSDLFQKQHRDD